MPPDMADPASSPDLLVSVVVPTYQHAGFIATCLDSILGQETTFPIEILVGEDESTDGTREICQRYAAEHPDRIRLFLRSRKDVMYIMGRPTGRANLLHLLREAKGKYIAMCEGDDHWTDPLKLQLQVDFMETHPEHAACFHRAMLLRGTTEEPFKFPDSVDPLNVRYVDLIRYANFIPTASLLFRNILGDLPAWMAKLPFADMGLHLLLSRHGKIACLNEFMSVYRITGQGAWSGLPTDAQDRSYLRFAKLIGPHLNREERDAMREKTATLLGRVANRRWPGHPRIQRLYRAYLRCS